MSHSDSRPILIVGDIASPTEKYSQKLDEILNANSNVFSNKNIIGNLEGLVMDDYGLDDKVPILFNHSSVLNVLAKWNTIYVGLANNHTLDRADCFDQTINYLEVNGISYSGSGTSKEKAYQPAVIKINNQKLIIFNSCWHIMLQHQKNPSKGISVATIDEEAILKMVVNARLNNPDSKILIYPHWNFDLETLPFPVHRKWSRDLIDAGADLIIGGHSHCIQGGEKYKSGWILYGVGNFYIPWYTFINGHISFPDFAKYELAVEWDLENEPILHFYKYEPGDDSHTISHISSEEFSESKTLLKYSPYSGMSDSEYKTFFTKNRRKNKLVPVYSDYKAEIGNKLKDLFLISRIKLARKLAQLNLRGWNN